MAHTRGGGCLIAVRNNLISSSVPLQNSVTEQIFVKVTNNETKLIIGAVYIPPNSGIESYVAHTDVVDDLMTRFLSFKFTILGDFNLPGIVWLVNDNDLSFKVFNDTASHDVNHATWIHGSFLSAGLRQYHPILIPDKGYSLDLLFSYLR